MTRPGDRIRRLAARVYGAATMARLIDPIVADLQHEHAEALREGRVWKSRRVRLAGYLALLKVMALHGGSSAESSASRRMIAYAIAVTAAVTMLFALPPLFALMTPSTVAAKRLWLLLYITPQAVPLAIPVGVTLGMLSGLGKAALSRRAARVMLIIAIVSSIASFVMMAWVAPATNMAFLETLTGRPVVKGISELTIGELHQRMLNAPHARHLAMMCHARLAFSCATFVLGLFALAVRHCRPLVRVALGVLACVLYVGFYITFTDVGYSDWGQALSPIAVMWLPNVAMTAIAILLALLARVQRVPQGMNL